MAISIASVITDEPRNLRILTVDAACEYEALSLTTSAHSAWNLAPYQAINIRSSTGIPTKTVLDLPVEIFLRIAGCLRKRDLARLLCVSRAFHHTLIPILYADISVDIPSAIKFFRTMTSVIGDEVPGMVRSLSIRGTKIPHFLEFHEFLHSIYPCLERMTGLRDVELAVPSYLKASVLLTLMSKKHVRSVSIIEALDLSSGGPADWAPFDRAVPLMHHLTTLQLTYSINPIPKSFAKYLSNLLKMHAGQLKHVDLNIQGLEHCNFLRSPLPCHELKTLSVPASVLADTSLFEHTPNLVSLGIHIPVGEPSPSVVEVPTNLLPNLSSYIGPSDVLTQLNLLAGRPLLSSLQLDYARFGTEYGSIKDLYMPGREPRPFEVLSRVLMQMENAQVRRVAIFLDSLSSESMEQVAPFMKSVEHLTIWLSQDWSVSYL